MINRLTCCIAFLGANFCYASWPLIHFLKCKITTPDTVVVGYFIAPFEDQPDSTIAKLKTDKDYFTKRVLNQSTTIELNSFTYIHRYKIPRDSVEAICVFKSTDRLLIDPKTIKEIELIDVINFQFVPNRVVTKIYEQDTVWLKKEVHKVYQDTDRCYPFRYLVYDDKVDYDRIINEVMIQPEKNENIMETFGRYRILAIRLNQCD